MMHRKYATHEDYLEYRREYNRKMLDVLDLIKCENICLCCGATPVQFDHIVPLKKRGRGHSLPFQAMFRGLSSGNIQFLCGDCNMSKNDGTICRTHNKYLGLWNYLPNLGDMEQ